MAVRERLAVHTITTRPWSLAECAERYRGAGVRGISVWREAIEPVGLDTAAAILAGSGLAVPALVRGGFFVHDTGSGRAAAIDSTRRCLDEAAAIGAGTLVIVPGAHPAVPLADGRAMVAEALAALADEAAAREVTLGLEPLHPMYAADRSCVSTLEQARVMCDEVDHAALGVVVDVYHVWWDPDWPWQIAALGRDGRLLGLHVCDWKADTADLLTDRGLMGEGCAPIAAIEAAMRRAGFAGMVEVEVLSERYWAEDQTAWLEKVVRAFDAVAWERDEGGGSAKARPT